MSEFDTLVVHCKKAPYDVYIGRPGPWGNPFSHQSGTLARASRIEGESPRLLVRSTTVPRPRLGENS